MNFQELKKRLIENDPRITKFSLRFWLWDVWQDIQIRLRVNKAKWFFQKAFRGYSDEQLWDTGEAIALYATKLLKAYRDRQVNHPHYEVPTEKLDILNEMIDGWENIARWDDISRQMLKNYRPYLDNLKKGEIAPLLTKEEEKQYH